MNSILLQHRFEDLYGSDEAGIGRHLMVRSKEKSLGWMMVLVHKSSDPIYMVMNTSADSTAVPKACLLLSTDQGLAKYRLDEVSVNEAYQA